MVIPNGQSKETNKNKNGGTKVEVETGMHGQKENAREVEGLFQI